MHLGIDLGGTKTEIIVLNADNKAIYNKRVPSPQGDYTKTLTNLSSLILEAEKSLGQRCTIGIGIPGSISPTSGLVQNANSTWLIGNNLKQDLECSIGRPVALANDADCFTLSEASDGAAKDQTCVFGVILGTGVGGGICINQHILVGPNAITGEWGHNVMPAPLQTNSNAAQCYCGKTHCIETYLSGPAFVRRTIETTGAEASSVQELLKLSTEDTQIKDAFERYYEGLAYALAQVVNVLDPNAIVLGGGLSNLRDLYIEVPKRIKKYVFSEQFETPIQPAKYGDASGVRGAAWLGR